MRISDCSSDVCSSDLPLPDWAAEIDCASWGQIFLKYILSHPAMTCVIPGTDDPRHMADNLGAGRGRLPDQAERRRIAARSEERRVGKACVSPCRARWSPYQ